MNKFTVLKKNNNSTLFKLFHTCAHTTFHETVRTVNVELYFIIWTELIFICLFFQDKSKLVP